MWPMASWTTRPPCCYLFIIARIHRVLNLKQISLTTAALCVTWHHLTASLGRQRRRVWAISVNPHVLHVHADMLVRARVSNTQAEQKLQRPARPVISFYFKWTVAAEAGNQCNDSPVQPGSLFKPYNWIYRVSDSAVVTAETFSSTCSTGA